MTSSSRISRTRPPTSSRRRPTKPKPDAKPKPAKNGEKTNPDDDEDDDAATDDQTDRENADDEDDDDEDDDDDDAPFTDDELKLLKRAKLHKSPAILALKGKERGELLDNLRARIQYTDQKGQEAADLRRRNAQLQQELEQFKTGNAGGKKPAGDKQQQRQTAGAAAGNDDDTDDESTPDLDQAWSAVAANQYSDDHSKALRAAVRAELKATRSNDAAGGELMQTMGTLGGLLEDLHFEQGLGDWEAPEGVDPSDEKVRTKIRKEAEILFGLERQRQGQKFNPRTFNLRHATKRAAFSLFNEKASSAAARKTSRAEQSKRSRRGSPESGQRPTTARPAATQEERDDQWFEAHMKA
jgi:hypothetical protein